MSSAMPTSRSGPARTLFGRARRYIRHLFATAIWIALCFGGAGRLDWPRGWICVGVYIVCVSATGLLLLLFNREVLEARARWEHADTRSFDRTFMSVFFPLTLIQPLVAGMDAARFRWLPMPPWTVAPGAALCVLSTAIICAALLANPFAETTVRLQSERGHRVISAGVYRLVRHPMYVGLMLLYPSLALMFGSGWAMIVAAVIAAAIVWRTAQEDRFLQSELPGYAEYAQQTRFRLVPGLW
jgi:protein-S-isoprenylcysteine O-methyltransferase Ste14